MTPEAMMTEITAALRDAIWDTPDASRLEDSPEDVYRDLAARLVIKLSRKRLTIAPSVDVESGKAAMRIFEIFTKWMSGHFERALTLALTLRGNFEVVACEGKSAYALFQGENVQDAFGQAAQAISFNGGLDGEALREHGND